ncbi:unnamed protein product [Malus baccata var. baccata]
MDSKALTTTAPLLNQKNPNNPPSKPKPMDFLSHLEAYLAKRDGIDKLVKISRYATKIVIASSAFPKTLPLMQRLKSFESSVGVSRKALILGKFIQDINALRSLNFVSNQERVLFVWLVKSRLIYKKHSRNLQKISTWAEFIGYTDNISLKFKDLNRISEDEKSVKSSIEIAITRGNGCEKENERLRKLCEKKMMKRLSVVQDSTDALMALANIRDGGGQFLGPLSVSLAGMLSTLINTHKNWVSC